MRQAQPASVNVLGEEGRNQIRRHEINVSLFSNVPGSASPSCRSGNAFSLCCVSGSGSGVGGDCRKKLSLVVIVTGCCGKTTIDGGSLYFICA